MLREAPFAYVSSLASLFARLYLMIRHLLGIILIIMSVVLYGVRQSLLIQLFILIFLNELLMMLIGFIALLELLRDLPLSGGRSFS
jgi:hypothetical protein